MSSNFKSGTKHVHRSLTYTFSSFFVTSLLITGDLVTGNDTEITEAQILTTDLVAGANALAIDPNRFTVLNDTKPYADGKECDTGQEPFTPAETALARQYWKSQREDLIDATPPNSIVVMLPTPTRDRLQRGKANCKSRICTYDFERFSYVCGRLLAVAYRDGASCLDGTTPGNAIVKREKLELQPEPQAQFDGKVNQLFGHRCKSKKCYYHFHKDAFICKGNIGQLDKLLLCIIVFLPVLVANMY